MAASSGVPRTNGACSGLFIVSMCSTTAALITIHFASLSPKTFARSRYLVVCIYQCLLKCCWTSCRKASTSAISFPWGALPGAPLGSFDTSLETSNGSLAWHLSADSWLFWLFNLALPVVGTKNSAFVYCCLLLLHLASSELNGGVVHQIGFLFPAVSINIRS